MAGAMGYESNQMWGAMKEVHYQRTIRTIEKGIKNSVDLKSALSSALDTVVHAVKAEAGTFWFHDSATDGRIRPFAVYGGGDLGDFSLSLGEGIAGKVIERGKEIIVEDCTEDPRWQGKADAKTGFITKSMIAVPLRTSTYTFGCIQIINKRGGDLYDGQDLLFVTQLANFAAEMFERLGFVASTAAAQQQGTTSLSLADLCTAKDSTEMKILLRSIKEFAELGVKDQKVVLEHMEEVYNVFARNKGRR